MADVQCPKERSSTDAAIVHTAAAIVVTIAKGTLAGWSIVC